MSPEPPSRALLKERLIDLLAGRITREEVADWAVKWVRETVPVVDDLVAWAALKELSGADLRVSPTEYLHDESDFHEWLDRLEVDSDL